MQSIKEKAANAAASAKAGMEKTKAAMQEKVEKMLTTGDPTEKELATQKKEERIQEAERQMQEAGEHNVAARQEATGGGALGHDCTPGSDHSTIGSTERPSSGVHGSHGVVRQDYPQGLSGSGYYPDRGASRDGSHLVGAEDRNVAGGAGTGYGSSNTV